VSVEQSFFGFRDFCHIGKPMFAANAAQLQTKVTERPRFCFSFSRRGLCEAFCRNPAASMLPGARSGSGQTGSQVKYSGERFMSVK
jgi:hypothetical protein